jgi:hypothetical protein
LATGAGNPAIAPLRVRRIRPSGSSHVHRSFTNQKPLPGRQGHRDAQDGRSDQPDRSPRFPEPAPGAVDRENHCVGGRRWTAASRC